MFAIINFILVKKLFFWVGTFGKYSCKKGAVVSRGQPADIVEVCIKCFQHWLYVQQFSLTENMRVQSEEEEFSLLKFGN